VGKIGIPDAILNKPGRLTADEFEIMKTHAEIGQHIFKSSSRPIMEAARIIAHQHHERWNGRGYPRGLKGEEIHIFGRIIGLVDVFDALICQRCYKAPWPPEKVRALIESEIGEHFDPAIARLALTHFNTLLQIHAAHPDA
jgi:putative two-component system response regulator